MLIGFVLFVDFFNFLLQQGFLPCHGNFIFIFIQNIEWTSSSNKRERGTDKRHAVFELFKWGKRTSVIKTAGDFFLCCNAILKF